MSEVFLSVIVPAYNEERNVARGKMDKLIGYLRRQDYEYEIILVDDGSEDATLEKLKEWGRDEKRVKVVANPHQGKALTVISGLVKAKGKYRLFTDFDQSTPISEVEKLLPFTKKGYDLVIGSREVKGSKREDEPWYRHMMGKVFNLVVKMFTVRGIQDTQCGFKLLSAKAVDELGERLRVTNTVKRDAFTGAFDVELLYLAHKRGLRVAEVPVHWKHEQTLRVNPFKDSVRMFAEVVKIRWVDMTGGYDKKR